MPLLIMKGSAAAGACTRKIEERDKKTLVITEVPFSTTTVSLIESIIAANDKGKIKIKKIDDHTSQNVEIIVHLAPGISPDVTIDALYAFTDCEVSVSPNTCVIQDDKPRFMSVNDMWWRAPTTPATAENGTGYQAEGTDGEDILQLIA
jgi:DNA gyrase/topoisomerase IV subunit A